MTRGIHGIPGAGASAATGFLQDAGAALGNAADIVLTAVSEGTPASARTIAALATQLASLENQVRKLEEYTGRLHVKQSG